MSYRALGLGLLALGLGVTATRNEPVASFLGVHEGRDKERTAMVPGAISRALQGAVRSSQVQVKALSDAQDEASSRKAKLEFAAAKKMALLEDAKRQETACEEEERKKREALVNLEKANSEHTMHSAALDQARDLWNKLSSELEVLQKGVKAQETALMETLYAMETALEAKKKEVEAKREQRDAAQADMTLKEDKVKAAGHLKKESEEQQMAAEKRSQQAQEALEEIRTKVKEAVEEALKAQLEQAEAADQLTEAQRNHERGAESMRLLRKLKAAVEDFFSAIDALDQSMMAGTGKAHERILIDPNLEPTLRKYNLMVAAFGDVFSFDDAVFKKIEPAIEQIVDNTKADLELLCDPTRELGQSMAESPELEEKCWTNLWQKVGINELPFPGQETDQVSGNPNFEASIDAEIVEDNRVAVPVLTNAVQVAPENPTTLTTPGVDVLERLATPEDEQSGAMTSTASSTQNMDDLLSEETIISPEMTSSTAQDVANLALDSLGTETSTTATADDIAELLGPDSMESSKARIAKAIDSAEALGTSTTEDVAQLLSMDSASPTASMTGETPKTENTLTGDTGNLQEIMPTRSVDD